MKWGGNFFIQCSYSHNSVSDGSCRYRWKLYCRSYIPSLISYLTALSYNRNVLPVTQCNTTNSWLHSLTDFVLTRYLAVICKIYCSNWTWICLLFWKKKKNKPTLTQHGDIFFFFAIYTLWLSRLTLYACNSWFHIDLMARSHCKVQVFPYLTLYGTTFLPPLCFLSCFSDHTKI